MGSELGVQVRSPSLPDGAPEVSCVVSGIGKVAAAHAASALVARGVDAIFVVGTCGGLSPRHAVGDFVHLFRAVQWDLSAREGRDVVAHRGLSEAWQRETGGGAGWTLTADRPAIRWVSRWRRARAVRGLHGEHGLPVADMETAAVGAVAERAEVPWAGLRVISDAQRSVGERVLRRSRGASSFEVNYKAQAGRPAQGLWDWLSPSPALDPSPPGSP